MHKSRKKMSRREIKQDPLLIWTSRVSMFLEQRLYYIIGGVAVFVLLVIGIWMYGSWSDRRDERGLQSVAQLGRIAQMGDAELTISEADRLIGQYGGHTQRLAKLYKADALRQLGDYEAAGALYEELSRGFRSGNEVHSFRAVKGHADALGARGEYAEAAGILTRWARRHADTGLAPHALMEAAICHELAGQHVEAKNALQTIVNDYSEAQVVGEARRRLKLMEGAVAAGR